MEKIKDYFDYTKEELSKMDSYTIADLIWEHYKRYGRPRTLEDNLDEYEEKHRMEHW